MTEQRIPRDLFDKFGRDGGSFSPYRIAGDRYYTRPMLEGVPGPHMRWQGRDVLVWSINDYLGLCSRRDIWEAAADVLRAVGPGTPMGSRLLTGNTKEHEALEEDLAHFVQQQAAIAFNYGYMGVTGTLASLLDRRDTIILDSEAHASMVDGSMLVPGVTRRVFAHNDMDNLESILREVHKTRRGGILIAVEGVYGMRGDIAPLADIRALKTKYEARLFVDDAHGVGVMGPSGIGTGSYTGTQADIDVYFGTFAKAFAAIGGFTAGSRDMVDYVRYNARTQIFAKSLPLIYVAVARQALQLVVEGASLREVLFQRAAALRSGLTEAGFRVNDGPAPITCVYLQQRGQSDDEAQRIIKTLREVHGIFVSAVTYPVVPKGVLLLRMIPTAAHSEEDVERTVRAFHSLRNEFT